ncbi:integrin alpha-IIb [Bombyx mori]|uniref:Uncharacterized protein n=1 Tax=Bombyx mori TaxID=7091 RepID=A0A8R2C7Y6_BOMMO|nr:integrin alpha-IIb [Bombyx mori]
MRLVLFLCLLQQYILRSLAIYSMLASKKILPPVRNSNLSYFGFGIAYVTDKKSLIISAPIEDNIGQVYVCQANNFTCESVKRHILRENDMYDHNYWLGATVEAGPTFFVTCAPLLVHNMRIGTGSTGGCFISKNDFSIEKLFLRRENSPIRTLKGLMSSYGWSLAVSDKNSVVVGGPGISNGKTLLYMTPEPSTQPDILDGMDMNVNFNFGYSVTTGYFATPKLLMYAVSSTYRLGQVLFYGEQWRFFKQLKFEQPKTTVGEMFGASLCSARIFGPRSDLLVGAPGRASDKQYNVGAVYVFVAEKPMALSFKRIITGRKEGSMFGSAIINIGDLNGDRKDDIAIAAPFENDGRGAVYLYCGAEILGSKEKKKPFSFLQVIESEDHGFGLALSVLKDYDQNGCNELAIGSPFNDTVYVLPCFAYVTVQLYTEFPDLQNQVIKNKGGGKEFLFKSCLHVTYPKKPAKAYAEIEVQVEISGNTNASLSNPGSDGKYKVKIEKTNEQTEQNLCKQIGVFMPKDGQYDSPINVKITAKQINDPQHQSHFDPSHVRIHESSLLTLGHDVWAAQCQNKMSCLPDIRLNIVNMFPEPYLLGSSETEDIKMEIKNHGEVAYSACLKVDVINAAIVRAPALSCTISHHDYSLTCISQKPIHTNDTWDLGNISLKMTQATNKDEFITIRVKVFGNCKLTQNFTLIEKQYKLTRDLDDIEIIGRASLGTNITLTAEEIKLEQKNLDHIYTIRNKVENPWIGGPTLQITFMNLQYLQYTKTPIIAQTETGVELDCAIISTDSKITTNCTADKLVKGDQINVIIHMNVDPSKIDDVMSLENLIVESKIEVFPGSLWSEPSSKTILSQSVVTTVTIEKTTVALWIIVVASLLGLLLLSIIYCIVVKRTNLLRRKNKEKTKVLRKSIRRQTMRRSMMAQSAYGRLPEDEPRALSVVQEDLQLCETQS